MDRLRRLSLGALLAATALYVPLQNRGGQAHAQDLKDELDALDDFPEDDLSELSSSGGDAASGADELSEGDLPDSDLPGSGETSTADSASKAAPSDDALGDLGDDDLGDLEDGLDSESLDDLDSELSDAASSDSLDSEFDDSTDQAKENAPTTEDSDLDDLSLDDVETADGEDKATPPSDSDESLDDLDAETDALADETAPTQPEVAPPAQPSEALTGVSAEPSAKLTGLDFKQLPDRVRLILHSDKPVDFSKEVRSQRKQVIVELRNLSIGKSILKRALDTGEFDGPVALVQAYDSKSGALPSVKVLFQLRKNQTPMLTRNGSELYVDFPIATDGKFIARLDSPAKSTTPAIPKTFLSIDENSRFTGTRVSLNVKDAELPDVLNFLSKASGRNFVLAGATQSKVTLNVVNTPWDQILALILFNNKLGYQRLGNVYRIIPAADLKTEIDDAAKVAASSQDLIPTQTQIIPIGYAKAKDIEANIKDFMTKRGKTSVDERTNSLVATDIPSVLDKIREYIRTVDKQTAQVLIEGRIVDAKQEFTKSLNIDWKLGEFGTGKFAGSFVNVGKKGSGLDPLRLHDQLSPTGEDGGLRLQLGQLSSLGAIQALLGLAERENKAKVIASPRITVLDNKTANITQGQSFAFPQASVTPGVPGGISTVNADLSLDVTPQVTSDGYVLMKIDLKRDTPDDVTRGDLTKRQAKTEMLVESGKTAVVGGIYTLDKKDTQSGWPFLRNLPIFGALFRDINTTGNSSNELLMFISPTILNPDKTFLSYGGSTLEDEMDNVKTNANNKGVEKISAKADKKADDDFGNLDDLDSELDTGTTSVKPDKSSDDLGGDALDDLDSLDDIPEDLL